VGWGMRWYITVSVGHWPSSSALQTSSQLVSPIHCYQFIYHCVTSWVSLAASRFFVNDWGTRSEQGPCMGPRHSPPPSCLSGSVRSPLSLWSVGRNGPLCCEVTWPASSVNCQVGSMTTVSALLIDAWQLTQCERVLVSL